MYILKHLRLQRTEHGETSSREGNEKYKRASILYESIENVKSKKRKLKIILNLKDLIECYLSSRSEVLHARFRPVPYCVPKFRFLLESFI